MLIAEKLTKRYGDHVLLDEVDLTVADGEFLSIMGESGSGKSTLISILGGFLAQDGGKVFWDGRDISEFSERELSGLRSSRVGFVFQFFKLIPTLNVKDNILLPCALGGNVNADTVNYMNALVRELKLDSLLLKYPDELSGGQRQRVAIVRALLYKPSLLILDEPTGALDSGMEKIVMNLLLRINREDKTTVIMVTHSNKVAEYAGRIINLRDGDIV